MTEHITVSRELLRQVLEPIERATETAMHQTLVARIPESGLFGGIAQDLNWATTELRAALEQPAVEPVAWIRPGGRAMLDAGGYCTVYAFDDGMSNHSVPLYAAPQAQQPAVEPFGHVTVRRLSQRFENHTDQYVFYPAGQAPYLDNVDECHALYTAPPPPADVPLLTDEDRDAVVVEAERLYSLDMNGSWRKALMSATETAVRQKAGLK